MWFLLNLNYYRIVSLGDLGCRRKEMGMKCEIWDFPMQFKSKT